MSLLPARGSADLGALLLEVPELLNVRLGSGGTSYRPDVSESEVGREKEMERIVLGVETEEFGNKAMTVGA